MNENKIAFIYCVNDEALYEKSLSYINKLQMPESMEFEIIVIRNAKSMTSAYNEAIQKSSSKYKVYLHQDVFIQNTNFINNILNIFKMDINIGLIGMVGAKIIPVSGVWWEDPLKVGKVFDSHTNFLELLDFNKVTDPYTEVKGVDGLIMITQYDLPWRDDIFDGWHYYDLSQSLEFTRKKLKVVVPNQDTAWCIHDCGYVNTKNGFEEYREKFLDNYSRDIFPLVSILIPAYNQTKYLKQAIDSALNQTYRNTEIIVGDDSTTEDVYELVVHYMENTNKIKYFNNGGPAGGKGKVNIDKCFAAATGEYISYLLHDDLYTPNRIDKMINYFLYDDTLSLITSYRKLINENGEYLNDKVFNFQQYSYDIRLTGEEAGRNLLFSLNNYIGELTTAIFKKNMIDFGPLNYNKYTIHGLNDISLWLKLLTKGNMIYISEPLSKFRIHDSQNTNDSILTFWWTIDFFNMGISSYENNAFIHTRKELLEFLMILYKHFNTNFIIFSNYYNTNSNSKSNTEIIKLRDEFMNCYIKFVNILLE